MSDEFESNSIDLNKWVLSPEAWAGRRPGLFRPQNVEQRNGAMKIWMRKENNLGPGWEYSTGYARTRAYQKYGYFEIGCTVAPAAFSSAFWLNNNSVAAGHWTEIDVFENGTWPGQQNFFQSNTHIFKLRVCQITLSPVRSILTFGLVLLSRRMICFDLK